MTKKDDEWNPDDDEEEDDLDMESTKEDTNKVDAEALQKTQEEALSEAYKVFATSISDITDELEHTDNTSQKGEQAKFLLRILRFVKSSPPVFEKQEIVSLDNLASNLLKRLHVILSDLTIRKSMIAYRRSLKQMDWNKPLVFKILWEGDPALPAQPSPSVFKMLYKIVEIMGGVGVDIWRSDAVQVLKQTSKKEIWEIVEPILSELQVLNEETLNVAAPPNDNAASHNINKVADNTIDAKMEEPQGTQDQEPQDNELEVPNEKDRLQIDDDDDTIETHEAESTSIEVQTPSVDSAVITTRKVMSHDNALQLLFDLAYLDTVLRIKNSYVLGKNSSAIQNGDSHVASHISLSWEFLEGDFIGEEKQNWAKISELERTRVFSSVEEYWRRTALLFGLLDV